MEKATFGAGCFWHVEADFRKIRGVKDIAVGYMGGKMKNPMYEDVCTDRTGHIEVAEISFEPKILSYKKLVEKFFELHNPTSMDKQGADVGTQYRSVIFYHNKKQKELAEKTKHALEDSGKYKKKIVTIIRPREKFYKAEEYHQRYYEKHGQIC